MKDVYIRCRVIGHTIVSFATGQDQMDEAEAAFDALCFEYGIELDDVVRHLVTTAYLTKEFPV